MPKQIIEGVCPECGADKAQVEFADPLDPTPDEHAGITSYAFVCKVCHAYFEDCYKKQFVGQRVPNSSADIRPAILPATQSEGEVEKPHISKLPDKYGPLPSQGEFKMDWKRAQELHNKLIEKYPELAQPQNPESGE